MKGLFQTPQLIQDGEGVSFPAHLDSSQESSRPTVSPTPRSPHPFRFSLLGIPASVKLTTAGSHFPAGRTPADTSVSPALGWTSAAGPPVLLDTPGHIPNIKHTAPPEKTNSLIFRKDLMSLTVKDTSKITIVQMENK